MVTEMWGKIRRGWKKLGIKDAPRLNKEPSCYLLRNRTQEEVAVGEIGSLVYCNTFWEQKMTSAHQQKDGHLKPWGWRGHQGLKCEQKRGPNSKQWRISSSEVTQERRSQQRRLKQKPEKWGKLAECSIWKPDKDSSQSCCRSRELRAENPITGIS